MKIKLIGELHPELTALGLKAGDIVEATRCNTSKTGVVHFVVNGQVCSLWPDNYVETLTSPNSIPVNSAPRLP